MPIGNTEINRCPRCNQAVFHAEAIPAAGKQWHKTCYRCGTLKIFLFFSSDYDEIIFIEKVFARKC
jgi:ribosomal protein S27AE